MSRKHNKKSQKMSFNTLKVIERTDTISHVCELLGG